MVPCEAIESCRELCLFSWWGAGVLAAAADRAADPEVARRERLTALFYALGERWLAREACTCILAT